MTIGRSLVAVGAILTLATGLVGCNVVGQESATGTAALPSAEQPADSDLTSLGPDAETRIYYQFIDDQRRVRFVERLEDVPEAWRATAGFVEMDGPPPLSPADARRSRDQAGGGPSTLAAAARPPVLLYYAEWCGYCRKAKAHLNDRGVPFELRDVQVPAAKAEMIAKTGDKGIPVIDVGGRILKGYSASGLDAMLLAAGYR